MPAEWQIRETNSGNAARAILDVADQHDAHVIVLGSNLRTDVPLIPLGSVSHKLLHMARRPVLVVPHHKAARPRTARPGRAMRQSRWLADQPARRPGPVVLASQPAGGGPPGPGAFCYPAG